MSDQLLNWKKRYGQIYSVSARNVDYIFRGLTFSEYDDLILQNNLSAAEKEDYIVSAVLLAPEGIDFSAIPAGVVSALAEQVLEYSGLLHPTIAKQILEEKRASTRSIRGLMYAFVIATIPAYTPEALDSLTFSKLAELVALAEQIIEVKQAYSAMDVVGSGGLQASHVPNNVTFDLVDPEEEAKQQQAEDKKQKKGKRGRAASDDPIAAKLHAALAQNRPYTPGEFESAE